MRKLLKKLRYIVEFFGSLYPPANVKPFVMQLKKLQDVFGYVNDVVTASQLEGISDEHCREDRECQRATGFVIGWHVSQAATSWAGARGTGKISRKVAGSGNSRSPMRRIVLRRRACDLGL